MRGNLLIRLFGAVLFLRGGFHDHTADLLGVGFVHDEPPAAALENFSLLGNMPGFKAQVAADGIHLVSFQLDAEFFQILKVGAAGQRITRIPERMDILFLGRVVLVFDVAHDLLKDVLDSGEAGRSAIFVHGNGDMVLALVDDSATVKTFYKEEDHYRLQPQNDAFSPIIVKHCEILGKVIGLVRIDM